MDVMRKGQLLSAAECAERYPGTDQVPPRPLGLKGSKVPRAQDVPMVQSHKI